MIAVLTVMSDMDLSHYYSGFGWIGFGLGLSWSSLFGVCNRWKLVSIALILATRVRLVSLSRFWLQG
jgi:hypothetical protein